MSFVFTQKNIAAHWGKILFLGLLYILLGIGALSYVGFATLFSITYLGILLMVIGVGEIVFGFQTRKEGSLGFHLFLGVLAIAAGISMSVAPLANILVITLAASIFLVARGVVQMIGSALNRYPYWGWSFWDGLLSLMLGGMIIALWPGSSLWAIGTFVGIALLFYGIEFVTLAFIGKQAQDQVVNVEPTKPSPPPIVEKKSGKDLDRNKGKDLDQFF